MTDRETARNHPEASNADRADHNPSAPDGKAALNAMDDPQRTQGGVSDCTVIWNKAFRSLMRVDGKAQFYQRKLRSA